MSKVINKRNICLAVCIFGIALLVIYELWISGEICRSCGAMTKYMIDMTVTRALGGAIFLSMLINLGYRVLNPIKKPFFRSLLISLPAFVIAINNFPFSQTIKGELRLEAEWWAVLLLLLECLCVGFFEECAFRGVVFLGILKKKPQSKLWAFISIALSSVVFGLVHLLNLLESSPVAVLMQIGYSALIGAMCAVVLMKSANIWLCVLIHGLFNFSGAVMSRLGSGKIWDTFTVVLTVIVSLAVTAYMICVFLKDDMAVSRKIFQKKTNLEG